MLLLLCRQGAWPNKRPRPMPAGPGGKDVVDEFLARDSFHGPAEAGHVREVNVARPFNHGEANSTTIAQNQEMCGILLHPGGEPHSGASWSCFAAGTGMPSNSRQMPQAAPKCAVVRVSREGRFVQVVRLI
jgi:hypothetical protein